MVGHRVNALGAGWRLGVGQPVGFQFWKSLDLLPAAADFGNRNPVDWKSSAIAGV